LRALLTPDQQDIDQRVFDMAEPQNPYTIRCIPQVHGIALDTIAFVRSILNVELNSATDNPMILRYFQHPKKSQILITVTG